MKKLLVILGPTATGKTNLALILAKKFNGEIVSCDSRQVYKNLNIGSGKHIGEEDVEKHNGYWVISKIPVWMFDVAEINTQYTVSDYVSKARSVISQITKKGKLPIIVGGSGLYLKALLEGLPNLSVPIDQDLRESLLGMTLDKLQGKLKNLSAKKWEEMNDSDRKNPRRLLRYIELIYMSPYKDTRLKVKGLKLEYEILKIGLTAPRDILYKKVDLNILKRLDNGMLEEVKGLLDKSVPPSRLESLGLEYKVLTEFILEKFKGKKDLVRILQGKIHGYVRRQQTWFKKEKDIFWFDITDQFFLGKVEKKVSKWYYSS